MNRALVLILTLMPLALVANAATKKKSKDQVTCERLYKQAEASCEESMCEGMESDPGFEACPKDGDFYEGLQICIYDNELPELIKAYNKKNPGKNLNCDDMDEPR
jgi:hypothetical protein